MKLSKNRLNILAALLKHPKMSDRKICTLTNTSQPTVTRIRAKLVKSGLLTFSAYPDLAQLGYSIIGFTELYIEKGDKEIIPSLQRNPSVIFITVQPSRTFVISVHIGIEDYEIFQAVYTSIINSMHIVTPLAETKKPIGFSQLIKTEK